MAEKRLMIYNGEEYIDFINEGDNIYLFKNGEYIKTNKEDREVWAKNLIQQQEQQQEILNIWSNQENVILKWLRKIFKD